MNEPIKIRKLPAKDRPLARRVKLHTIRMFGRRIYIQATKPGGTPRWSVDGGTGELIDYINSPVGQAQHVGAVVAMRLMNGET